MDNSPLIPRAHHHMLLADFDELKYSSGNTETNKKDNNSSSSSSCSSSTASKLNLAGLTKSSNNKMGQKLHQNSCSSSGGSSTFSSVEKKKSSKSSSSPIEIKTTPGKTRNPENNSRMSLFKVLTRRSSSSNQGKHKKLQDNWIQAREPVLDGVTFYVKFLGSTLIEKAGAADAADATKTVIQMVKAGQKTNRVGLTISSRGITILDTITGEIRLQISIYDIAHCSADANYPNVFTFIATNKNDVNECYCFASRKRKMAQQITLTIAQSFNLAFEIWQSSSMEKEHNDDASDDVNVIIGSSDSAKSGGSHGSSSHSSSVTNHHSQWVHFDDDQVDNEIDEITDHFNSINMVSLSPFRRNVSSCKSRRQNSLEEHEDLLICLN